MPARASFGCVMISTSPEPAYVVMLRATSEMAVAISVASVALNPICSAFSRPSWRARTMSVSAAIDTTTPRSSIGGTGLRAAAQQLETLLEIERCIDVLHADAQLHHRERDLRLDPDEHRDGSAQARHVRDRAERPGSERVDD